MRSTLLLALITLSAPGCAGHEKRPDPPPVERCLTLPDHFRCRAPDGKKYSDPYPGKVRRECSPTSDAEAGRDFEAVAR